MQGLLSMMVDAFTYNGEDDLLLIRLKMLSSVIDRFVIVEADKTFTGIPKKQKFNIENFQDYKDKISYFFIDSLSSNPKSPWENEALQRNSLFLGLKDLNNSDIFILSDVDEIPNPDSIFKFDPNKYIYGSLIQSLHCFRLSYQIFSYDDNQILWPKPKIITFGSFKNYFQSLDLLRSEKSFGLFRSFKRWYLKRNAQLIQSGGWHFSYLMSPDEIINKIQSFSHSELNTPEFNNEKNISDAISGMRNPFDKKTIIKKIDITHFFPKQITEDECFKKWI